MTTPNAEYNVVFGLSSGELREGGHCFEWDRAKFRQWAAGIAHRNGYCVHLDGIGDHDLRLGREFRQSVDDAPDANACGG